MSCRICNPPGPGICPECEEEAKRQARVQTAKIKWRIREVLNRLEHRDLIEEIRVKERRVG
jgi:hypothetical protein